VALARRGGPGGIRSLVELIEQHGEAIDADLQHHYRLSVADVITGRVTWRRFRGLLAGLPAEGTAQWRHARRNPAPDRKPVDPPDDWWTAERDLLASIIERLDVMLWRQTEDGHRGRNAPKPIPRPGVKAARKVTRLPAAEAAARLSRIGPLSGGPGLDAGADEHGEPDDAESSDHGAGDGETEAALTSAVRVAQGEGGEDESEQ
jgi:hypothetical protein